MVVKFSTDSSAVSSLDTYRYSVGALAGERFNEGEDETFGKRRMWLCEPGDHVPRVCGAFDFNLNTPTYNDLLAVSISISWENLSVEAFHDGREVQGPATSKVSTCS